MYNFNSSGNYVPMNYPSIKNKTAWMLVLLGLFASLAPADLRAVAQEAFAPPAFRLIGTIEGRDFSGAVLIDAAGKQMFYRLYDTAPDGSKITAVSGGSIVLRRPDGTRYELYIIHDMKAASASGAPLSSPVAPSAAAETRQLPFMQRPWQGPRGPGMIDAAREEAKARRHNPPPGGGAFDQGDGSDGQNSGPGPNSSASGADQAQHGQRPHGQPQQQLPQQQPQHQR